MKTTRTTFARTIVSLTALTCCLIVVPVGQESPTLQAMETPKAERLYPVGRKMLFSLYSVTEPELSTVRSDGFTAIGPYYSDKDLAAARARQAGVPYLHSVGPRIEFGAQPWGEAEENTALEALIAEVQTESRQPGLAIWYLANEEPRFWRPDEMRWLDQSTNAIKTYDPGERPIMVYEPNHRIAAELAKTAVYVDAVAKGSYANLVGMKSQRIWVRWSTEQVVEASESSDSVPIAVLLMYRDQESAADIAAIRDRTRHDVFLSLMSGAKGILIYSGHNSRPGFERDFRAFYDGYASAARDLNLDKNLAEIFLFGEDRTSPVIDIVDGPTTLSFDFRDETHTYPSVSSLAKSIHGRTFLFLVNSANQPVSVNIGGLPGVAVIQDFLDDSPVSAQELSGLVLPAYAFRVFAWNP